MTGNQEQIDYWNGAAGQTWVDAQARLDRMLAPLSQGVLARANATSGERVIDIGCGCGDTSLHMARAGAVVHGIDISEPMLEMARARAGQEQLGDRVTFSCADAAVVDLAPEHDLLFSRFGVMFFAHPVAAFANLRGALASGGRLCFLCWQAPSKNPWMAVAGRAVQPFLPEPDVAPDPRAPGPFAFGDAGYLQSILAAAGFADIAIDAFGATLHLADTLDEAMRFQGEVGPVARALSELEGDVRDQALAAAREALAAELTPTGINLDAACWVVTASNGARAR